MNELIQYYESRTNEEDRIKRYPLEFIRSKEIIGRYLSKEKMKIADIGGASGVYSFWLAELGHDVYLLDMMPRHIEQAKANAKKTGYDLAGYDCADARILPYDNNTFDTVLEMGPLYHLQNRHDRVTCLQESIRVLKAGCPVICAVISRYASLIDGFKFSFVRDEKFRDILKHDIETGCHNNPDEIPHYFTTAFLHTPEEIKSELVEAGFEDIKLIAVEGFANILNLDELVQDSQMNSTLMDYLRIIESTTELLGMSGHILAIGYKK
jgi:ubiquinone/menaquinone biosynthesis C-methylase UbiE